MFQKLMDRNARTILHYVSEFWDSQKLNIGDFLIGYDIASIEKGNKHNNSNIAVASTYVGMWPRFKPISYLKGWLVLKNSETRFRGISIEVRLGTYHLMGISLKVCNM